MAQQMGHTRARVTVSLSSLSISAGAITTLRLTWAFMRTDHIKHALVLHNAWFHETLPILSRSKVIAIVRHARGKAGKWSVQYKVEESTQSFSYFCIDLNLML